MPERVAEDYVRSARQRLHVAATQHRQASGAQFDDVFLDLANVSMFVWTAGIDVVSAIMMADGLVHLGNSRDRQRYVNLRLHQMNPHLELRILWPHLAQLHNFQHNLDLSQGRFIAACRNSGRLFEELNGLLPDLLQLPREYFAWLYEIN